MHLEQTKHTSRVSLNFTEDFHQQDELGKHVGMKCAVFGINSLQIMMKLVLGIFFRTFA